MISKENLCSPKFLLVLLILLNVLFVIGSIVLIGFGIYIQVDNNVSTVLNRLTDTSHFQGQTLGYFPYILIATGVFTFLVAIIGFMGVVWSSRWVLILYSVVLVILVILEIVGFSVAMAYKSNLESVYRTSLSTVLSTALNQTDTKVLDIFADLETSLTCCGVVGLDDYNGHEPKNINCYRYKNGCADKLIDIVKKYLPIVGVSLGIIILFELFSLICAIRLAMRLNDSEIRHYNPAYSTNVLINMKPTKRRGYQEF